MKKALWAFWIICPFYSLGQDAMLLNAYTNPLALNPAYSGGSKFPALYSNYSRSWIGLSPSHTYHLSIDLPLTKMPGGFGFRLLNDKVGNIFNHTEMEVMYAYSINLGENLELRPGAGIGINDVSLEVDRLNFGDQMHPRMGFVFQGNPNEIRPNRKYINLSGGFVLSGKTLNAGIAVRNIHEPDAGFTTRRPSALPRRLTFHSSYTIPFKNVNLTPYIISNFQGPNMNMWTGTYVSKGKFSIGAGYGLGNTTYKNSSINGMVGLNFNSFRIGYNMEKQNAIYNSLPGRNSWHSHELYLIATISDKKDRSKSRPANVPVF